MADKTADLAQWLADNHAGAPYTTTQIAKATGRSANSLKKDLYALVKDGKATRHQGGTWSAPW